jgi:hypothetical protein
LFIPPEVNELVDDLMGGDGPWVEPPTMVGEPQYDEASRTFSVNFQYKNSLPIDINVKSLTGNIECAEHDSLLGNASLSEPVSIVAGEIGAMTVLGTWTEEAVSHFANAHGDEENVDVVLVDIAVDIGGVKIQLDQSQMEQAMQVPNPAYKG